MQREKHELQVSRKKAEEERIRREMAAQNAEITDLTGNEPNSRDDTRPFCKGGLIIILSFCSNVKLSSTNENSVQQATQLIFESAVQHHFYRKTDNGSSAQAKCQVCKTTLLEFDK